VLLRTVCGVIDRSPTQLIHEIILVDDYSELRMSLTYFILLVFLMCVSK